MAPCIMDFSQSKRLDDTLTGALTATPSIRLVAAHQAPAAEAAPTVVVASVR